MDLFQSINLKLILEKKKKKDFFFKSYIYYFMLKLRSVTFGDLSVNKENCICLVEEHCSWSYFSLFMSVTSHSATLQ